MKKFKCKKIEEMLPSYLAGELSERDAKEISEHISVCDKCRASLQEWERCFSLIGSVPRLEAPAHIWQKIRAQLPRVQRKEVPSYLRWVWATCFALIVVVMGFTLFSQFSRPSAMAPEVSHHPTGNIMSAPMTKPAVPIITQKAPVTEKSMRIASKPKLSPIPRASFPTVARSQIVHAQPVVGEKNLEDKVVERLQMALLSAQSAEISIERALRTLQGETEF